MGKEIDVLMKPGASSMLSFHDIEDFKEIDAASVEQIEVTTGHKGPSDADQHNADPLKDYLWQAAERQRHRT